MAKTLNNVFKNHRIASGEFELTGGEKFTLYYTPITSSLVKDAEKLGDFLHAARSYYDDNDDFWNVTHERLLRAYRAAWIACKGNLLAPFLLERKSGRPFPIKAEIVEPSIADALRRMGEQKGQFTLRIDYLDAPPPDWKPDL